MLAASPGAAVPQCWQQTAALETIRHARFVVSGGAAAQSPPWFGSPRLQRHKDTFRPLIKARLLRLYARKKKKKEEGRLRFVKVGTWGLAWKKKPEPTFLS